MAQKIINLNKYYPKKASEDDLSGSQNVVTDANGKITTETKITKTSQLTNDSNFTTATGHNHDSRYYTESEIDTKLNTKANTSHDHNDTYYTESEIDTKLNTKANSSHTHDDRYYTETEIDTKLNTKSDTSHNHDSTYIKKGVGTVTSTNIVNNTIVNDDIAENANIAYSKLTGVAPDSHNHNDLYPTKEYVDTQLTQKANTDHTHGEFLTEHQNITGKEDKSNKTTSISSSSTDTQYPSSKAVYTYAQPKGNYLTSHNPIDSSLSTTSTNAVQNKVINTAINTKLDSTQPLQKDKVLVTNPSTGAIEFENKSEYIKKSSTSGYIKNDGTIGTPANTTYSNATTTTAGLMSSTDKTKLNGIATGANKTTVDTSLSSTSTNPVQNKVIQTALNNLQNGIANIELIEVVTDLPTTNISTNKLYFKANNTSESENLYDIFAYVGDNWEHIDALNIDISEYLKKADLGAGTGLTKSGTTLGITNGGVGATQLASNAVETAKIKDSAVTSAKIADGTIVNGDIANTTIQGGKLVNGTITATQLASNAVETAKIKDANVTTAKIADSNVTTAKIADSAITSAKIADGTIVNADIASNAAIVYSKLSGVAASSHNHPDTQINWNGTALAGQVSPVDMAMYEEFNSNRLAYLPGNNITIEYSTNSGSTWTDYGATAQQKQNLVTLSQTFNNGKGSTTDFSKNQLRITIDAGTIDSSHASQVYLGTRKLMLYFCECNALGTKVKIETAPYTANTTFTTLGIYDVKGWTGWNSIPINITYGGYTNQHTAAGKVQKLRLTFTQTGGTGNCNIQKIRLFGETCWTAPSNLANNGHMYTYDEAKNVTFPAKIIKSGGTSSQFLKADGSVDSTTYVATGDSRLSNARTPTAHTDSNGAYGKATTSVWGHTKLNSATNSTDETTAATPKAVKAAYDLANGKPSLGTTSTTAAKGDHNHDGTYLKSYTPPTASTSQAGIVQLSDSTSTTSSTIAATSTAVKAAYDKGNHSHPYISTTAGSVGTNNLANDAVTIDKVKFTDDIGGTNLLLNTQQFATGTNGSLTGEYYNETAIRRYNNTNGSTYVDCSWSNMPPTGTFKQGDKYTLSFWAKGTGTIICYSYGNSGYLTAKPIKSNGSNSSSYGDGNVTFTLSSTWKRFYVTWELNPNGADSSLSVLKTLLIRTNKGADSYIAGVMFEKGEIAHDWNINPFENNANKIVAASGNTKDLNNYTTAGFYYNDNNTSCAYISNLPESGKAFFLLIESWGASNYTKQTITHYNSNKTYTRIRNAGTWGSWKEISADTNTTYTAGTGLTLSGTQFSLTDASNYVKKSSTSGYIKNDGTIGTPTNTTYSAEKGITLSSGKFGHSNTAITAQTTSALKKIKYDAYGHITGTDDVAASDLPSHTHNYVAVAQGESMKGRFLRVNTNGNVVCELVSYAASNHTHDYSSTYAPKTHTHGNITNDGKVGTTATLPLITGTGGVVQAGSFGTAAGTFCQGNDSRLSNTRTPTDGTVTNAKVASNAAIAFSKLNITKANITGLGIPASNTTYTAGTGLQLSGTEFSVDTINAANIIHYSDILLPNTLPALTSGGFSQNGVNKAIDDKIGDIKTWTTLSGVSNGTAYINEDIRMIEYYFSKTATVSAGSNELATNVIPSGYRPLGSVFSATYYPNLTLTLKNEGTVICRATAAASNTNISGHFIYHY